MPKIYLVTLQWIETAQNPEMIDAQLRQYGDWIRWNGWTWFVSTNYAPAVLRMALMSKLTTSDFVIVSELTPQAIEGWAPNWVWDWFNSRWFPPPPPTTAIPEGAPPPQRGLLGD